MGIKLKDLNATTLAALARESESRQPNSVPARIATATCVEVPPPPSTNHLYLNTRHGRIKAPEYREWIAVASLMVMPLQPLPPGRFALLYTLFGGSDLNLGRDLGNIEKPLTDLLVSTKRICDDSLRAGLHEITLRFVECDDGAAFVRVEARQLSEEP